MKAFLFSFVFGLVIPVWAQQTVRQELATGHAPADLLRPALKKVLSEQGNFVILPQKGTVLVIDTPEKIQAAAQAIAELEAPNPDVKLDFAFRTAIGGGPSGPRPFNPVTSTGNFPYPTNWDPPRIIGGPGGFAVVPAHPRNFVRRNVGVTMETTGTVNPDGSITVDINAEHTRLDGFINYGSAILGVGNVGTVPVLGNVANPLFFDRIVNRNGIVVPIFETTRISTQVVVRPNVFNRRVQVEMIPQLKIVDEEMETEEQTVSLKDYHTTVEMLNGHTGVARGFKGASADFNRHFLGEKPDAEGGTAIMIRANIQSGKVETDGENEPPEER